MHNSTADWNDVLDSEAFSDITFNDLGLQGGEAGLQTRLPRFEQANPQIYLPGFGQAQEPQYEDRTFVQDWSHLGNVLSATQMQYDAVPHPATMLDVPAWLCQQYMVQQDVSDATATPSFPFANDTWGLSSLPAGNRSHATHPMDRPARLDLGDDERVHFGKQPLANPTSEAPAVSDSVMRRDADVSDSARPCSCPLCLNLHTNRFPSEFPSSDSVSRAHYSCRLPACGWMARGLDGAVANRYTNALLQHEKSHFGHKGRFTCLEGRCQYVTKRWGDLTRHYGSKHCTDTVRRFVCPVVWCKFSRVGFARKDKLKSHVGSVHRGAKTGVGADWAIRAKGQDGL